MNLPEVVVIRLLYPAPGIPLQKDKHIHTAVVGLIRDDFLFQPRYGSDYSVDQTCPRPEPRYQQLLVEPLREVAVLREC